MTAQAEEAGDFVRVASCSTPTEAHLLKGVLESAGLSPRVADANFVQAYSWMAPAAGGVRVLVPASQVAAARQAITDFNDGAYQLGDEEVAAPSYSELPKPLFSPDRAVLLSFVLTPAFGAAVQIANASILGDASRRVGQWVWLFLLAAASVAGIAFVHRLSPGPLVAFRASFVLSAVTVVWYFAGGQAQSRKFLATYGPKYQKRSLAKLSVVAAAALLILGLALSEFL